MLSNVSALSENPLCFDHLFACLTLEGYQGYQGYQLDVFCVLFYFYCWLRKSRVEIQNSLAPGHKIEYQWIKF